MDISLTPPLSPNLNGVLILKDSFLEEPEMQEESLLQFNCSNKKSKFLGTVHFQALLENSSLFQGKKMFRIFGALFNLPICFLQTTERQQLFFIIRQNVLILKKAASSQNRTIGNFDFVLIRDEITKIFGYILGFFQDLYMAQLQQPKLPQISLLRDMLNNFLCDLRKFLMYAGRLSDLPENCVTSIKHCDKYTSAAYNFFHLSLDLWWMSLELFHIIQKICETRDIQLHFILCIGNNCPDSNIFTQMANFVLRDLCILSLYFQKRATFINNWAFSPCECVSNFWTQLIVLLNHRTELHNESSFWSYLHFLSQQMLKNCEVSDSNDHNSNEIFQIGKLFESMTPSTEFFMMLVDHLVSLHENHSIVSRPIGGKSDDVQLYIKYLFEQVLPTDSSMKNEKLLRKIYVQFISLSRSWQSCTDIVLLLTEFYIKRIDDSFTIPGIDIQGLSYLFKDSKSWLDKLKTIILPQNNISTQENSFYLFLHILAQQLKPSDSSGNLWRQLKGRIWSKFTPKRLKDLSETGLQNCLSIFLTITLATNMEEVALKTCEVSRVMQTATFKNQVIATKAAFIIIFSCQKNNRRIDKVAALVTETFNLSCLSYSRTSQSTMQKNNIMSFLLTYVNNVKHIFESSLSLDLGEHILISSGFSTLLRSCGTELNYLLEIVISLLTRFLSLVDCYMQSIISPSNDHKLLFEKFVENIYSFIEEHSCTDTASDQVAEIATLYTKLFLKFSTCISLDIKPSKVFRQFGHKDSVNPKVILIYLNTIAKDGFLMQQLEKDIPDLDKLMFQSWLRCSLLISSSCSDVIQLSEFVLQQDKITRCYPELKILSFATTDHDTLCINFFQLLGSSYEKSLTLQNKNTMKEKSQVYFFDVPIIISCKFQNNPSHEFLAHIYKLCGQLIQYCSPLLYQKYKNQTIFADLIDILLFPHLVYPKDKFLPGLLASHINTHLPFIIRGLVKLDINNDSYVKRKVKDVLVHYLSTLAIAPNNPIISVAVDAASQKSATLNLDFFSFILEVVKDELLAVMSSRSVIGYQFCSEILKKIPTSSKRTMCDILLKHLIFFILRSDGSIAQTNKNLINTFFLFLKRETVASYRRELILSVLLSLVQEKLAWSQFKVFRILEFVADHFPSIVSDLIPKLTHHIEYLESQRGSGMDVILRKELKNLTHKIYKT